MRCTEGAYDERRRRHYGVLPGVSAAQMTNLARSPLRPDDLSVAGEIPLGCAGPWFNTPGGRIVQWALLSHKWVYVHEGLGGGWRSS